MACLPGFGSRPPGSLHWVCAFSVWASSHSILYIWLEGAVYGH